MIDPFSKRVEQLKNAYPDKVVDTVDIISIDGRKLFNRRQMADILNISDTQIKLYEANNMPRSQYSLKSYVLYDLKECVDWIALNIDLSKSNRGKKSVNELPDGIDERDWKTRNERAVALKNEELAEETRLKVLELKGELVRKDATDKALAEIGATMSAYYRNDLKSLPVLLENKNHIEIKEDLNKHYRDRMEDMKKIVSKHIEIEEESVFDKLLEWIKEKIA